MTRRTITSAVMAVALSAVIGGTALAAAPTFSGTWTCTYPNGSSPYDLEPLSGVTKSDIAEKKRFWINAGFCEPGSFDTSGLTKDA